MPIATVRGLRINYEIVGDDGPWMALITGGRRGYDEFVPLAKKFAAEGFRVLLHDRRNTGGSQISISADETEELSISSTDPPEQKWYKSHLGSELAAV